MKKFLKVIIPSIIALILVFGPASSVFASDGWPVAPPIDSDTAIIMDAYSSTILYEKDPDRKWYPASTTKILTCLLALENSTMDEVVEFSERALDLEVDAVTINSVVGEQMRMEDALYGLMLPSGNDCAVAIAEHIAGSVEAFADMMNERAKKIGATNSHFVNPNGLYDANHYSTARDMALIAQEAFKNSIFVKIISTPTYTAAPTNMSDERIFKNSNMFIHPETDYYDERVIGGKTGYLDVSGRCLVSFSRQNGLTLITVSFGNGDNRYGAFDNSRILINHAFDNFSMKPVSDMETRFSFASEKSKVVLDASAQVLMVNSVPLSSLASNIVFAKDMDKGAIKAAMEKGTYDEGSELFAVIKYSLDGHDLGFANVYLVPNLKIAKASFITVNYINIIYIIIFSIVIIVVSSFIAASKKRPGKATAQNSGKSDSSARSKKRQ